MSFTAEKRGVQRVRRSYTGMEFMYVPIAVWLTLVALSKLRAAGEGHTDGAQNLEGDLKREGINPDEFLSPDGTHKKGF